MPSDRPALVSLGDVIVRIDGTVILGPISLSIREGERWVILGPNGSGKTTLLTLVGARRQPSAGTATVLGLTLGHSDIRSLHPEIAHTSHALAELFPPRLRVMDIVLTGKRAALSPWFQTYDANDLARAEGRLDEVGCRSLRDRIFDTCSQGERQRILIARAMFGRPRLLVLDEPAAGLDLPARETLIDAVDRSVADSEQLAVIMATHHVEETPASTTHAALLRDGRSVASGPVGDVLTPDRLEACFGMRLDLSRRHGRWHAMATPRPSSSAPHDPRDNDPKETETMRRVVMVGTVEGRAVVTRDDLVAPRVLDVFPGAEFYLLWGSDRVPALPSTGERPTDTWIPGPDGARFGISVIPSGYGLTVDDLRTGLPEIERELPGLMPTLEPDHPGVHTTATLDFVLVVSGNITLELDDGQTVDASAGDCIVQAGTRHAWRNHSGEPCVLAISMVGTRLSSEDGPDKTRPSGEI